MNCNHFHVKINGRCIDATAEAISHLPELQLDISKLAKIHNPLVQNLRNLLSAKDTTDNEGVLAK